MTRDAAAAAAFHSATGGQGLSDRTWRDLALDAVFARLDRCATAIGAQVLYARLRGAPVASELDADAEMRRFDRRVRAFGEVDARRRFERAVKPLAAERSAALAPVLFRDAPALPRGARMFPVATALTFAAAVASAVWPLALLVFVGLVLGNIALRLHLHPFMTAHADALATVASLVAAAEKVAAIDALGDDARTLRAAVAAVAPWRRSLTWATLDARGLDEVAASLIAYVNVFFLVDVNAFVASLRLLRARGAALRTLFTVAGDLDAARAVALFRAENAHAVPSFLPPGAPIVMTAMRHPLVAGAVPNDVRIDARGWLVLGSNASGKSTCLKGIALQVVLAQSIATVTCERYAAPPLRVRTLIHVEDDVEGGRSHFQVEAEAVRDMLCEDDECDEYDKCAHKDRLCVVDELFRGTNTAERVAAGAAVLRGLHRRGARVLAATHDDELIARLARDFDPFYFAERVEGAALAFDYLLRAGRAAPRNAIAVLELTGVPADVIADARTENRMTGG
ncbi:MAG: hypothetical protein KIT84_14685 [Labilithrix sp.]|nr:hypothetical protein [Labilithrix sp.]MCW5812268.1 hypothetical protein [Labilithrix sp.]